MLLGRAASRVGVLLRQGEAGGWLRLAHDALGQPLARGGQGGARRGEASEDWRRGIWWDGVGVCWGLGLQRSSCRMMFEYTSKIMHRGKISTLFKSYSDSPIRLAEKVT